MRRARHRLYRQSTPVYADLFASATRLEAINGIDGSGLSDCTAAFNALSAGYYLGDYGRTYRIDGQWVAKNGVYVWGRGARIVSTYDPVSGVTGAIGGIGITGFGLYGLILEKADQTLQGRMVNITGSSLTYWDLLLYKFNTGGIGVNGDDIICRNIYLDSLDYLTGNFGIRSFGGARQEYSDIEGYTGDDMLVISTGPNVPTNGAGGVDVTDVTIRRIAGRSYMARLIALDLIDQDQVGGMTASIRRVSVRYVLGKSAVIGATARNLDSSGALSDVSLADIDITLTNPGAAGLLSTRPLSIIRQSGSLSNISTSNVIFRNTINQNVQPSGTVSNVDVGGVTCL